MQSKYCEHFQYLKVNQSLYSNREAVCKYCLNGPQHVWLCLSKGCNEYVCSKNNCEHLNTHLQESRKKKKFHSIFINLVTAEIRCAQCKIQIYDLDTYSCVIRRPINVQFRKLQDPFPFRLKILSGLGQLSIRKIVGQLQNSEGHKKISKGFVGLFSNKYNHTINSAIQFISHIKFFKQLILSLKISQKDKLLWELQQIIQAIEAADYRASHSDNISQLFYKEKPQLYGYRRKDPFELIHHIFSILQEETIFYSINEKSNDEYIDQWDIFYKKNKINANYIVYNSIQATLSLNYYCGKCQKALSVPQNIQFLKLNIPKKKRKTKQIEKQLQNHRCESPLKHKQRRNSLINLFTEEECPITIPELLIELMKSPLHKQMNCETCHGLLRKTKLHLQKLPDILIIQIARINKDGGAIDETLVELSTDSIDLGPFSVTPKEEMPYDFESAICIEKGCIFPIVANSQFNKQKYVIRNEIVELCKQPMNAYILCYTKRIPQTAKQKLVMINDDLKCQRPKLYQLPDFWYLQLKHGIERPFRNQLICKHNNLKPNIQSKMKDIKYISADVYEDLSHFYRKAKNISKEGTLSMKKISSSTSGQNNKGIYNRQVCQFCTEELDMINERRRRQKEYVLNYDKLKASSLPYCMISSSWIKKWSTYLYNSGNFAYMSKGFPVPPSIDNKALLQGNHCKANLKKNQDYRVLNIYLWKFLKELYGGGPQIRYKWKEGKQKLDEQMIEDIRQKASDLKIIYSNDYSCLESPKKLMTSLSYNEKSTIMNETVNYSLSPQIMLQEEEIEESN